MSPPLPSNASVVPTAQAGDSAAKPKLLDRLGAALRARAVPAGQVQAYLQTVANYVRFHGLRHPQELGLEHITVYLAHLRRQPEITPGHEAAARAALGFL